MSKTCLLRLSDKTTWIHYSRGRKTAVARRYADPGSPTEEYKLPEEDPELEGRRLAGATEVGLAKANAYLVELGCPYDPRTLRVKQTDEWAEVFKYLDQIELEAEGTPEIPAPAARADVLLAKAIPQTRLRRFYESLRLFARDEIHAAIAAYVSDPGSCVGTLQTLFGESANHFARYKNVDQHFHPENRSWRVAAPAEKLNANSLVGSLDPASWPTGISVSSETTNLNFDPVDFEISLWRTAGNAVFEDGRSGESSGRGGLDLLLRSQDGGLPIVGEIKAVGDTNLFLALIQALTYAAELTSTNQFDRLKKHYGQFTALDSASPRCDVYLIFLDDEPKLMKRTVEIARLLLEDPMSPVATKVRRIALVRASCEKQDHIHFDEEASFAVARV